MVVQQIAGEIDETNNGRNERSRAIDVLYRNTKTRLYFVRNELKRGAAPPYVSYVRGRPASPPLTPLDSSFSAQRYSSAHADYEHAKCC